MKTFSKCFFLFLFLFPSTAYQSSHIGPHPQRVRGEWRGHLTVCHLGAITRWDNILYGCHGNSLLGLGLSDSVSCCCRSLATSSWPEHGDADGIVFFFFSEANVLWRCFFMFVFVCVWGLILGRWNSFWRGIKCGGVDGRRGGKTKGAECF